MKLEGIITPLVTPFNRDENQTINFDATKILVNRLIEKGVSGLFILGTNGEFHVLSDEEKIAFAKVVIETANHRVPVFVGTGGCSTQKVIALSKEMKKIGADALSVITPYFIVPTKAEIINHYKTIASNVDIPIILYNFPKNTGINLTADIVKELADVKNIIAIKDSGGDMKQMAEYIESCKGKDMEFLVGSDSKMLEAFKLGAVGAVAGTSNLLTELDLNIYNCFKYGDLKKAEIYQNDLETFRDVNKKGTVPSVMKKAMELIGIPVGPARYPVAEVNDEINKELKDVLKYYNL